MRLCLLSAFFLPIRSDKVDWFGEAAGASQEQLPPNLQHPAGAVFDAFERLLALRSHMQATRHEKLKQSGQEASKTKGASKFIQAVSQAHASPPELCSAEHYAQIEQLARQLSNAGMGLNAWWAEPLPNGKPDVSFIKHGQWGIFERK